MVKFTCEKCGAEVWTKRATLCRKCAGGLHSKTKIKWPSREELEKMVVKDGFAKTAKKLGVSDSAIRKRLNK